MFISWLVSNCSGKRFKVFKEMQKYMTKDEIQRTIAYGKCFKQNMKCGPNGHQGNKQDKNCVERNMRRFKFYLAFENSECKDYVSEKITHAFDFGSIPIVLGGLKSDDYEELVPPNSYIHVDNFKSVKDLMKYIRYLDKNNTAYLEYFKWKREYKILGNCFGAECAYNINQREMCKICSLANKNIQLKPRSKSFSLENWWNNNNICK